MTELEKIIGKEAVERIEYNIAHPEESAPRSRRPRTVDEETKNI